MVNVTNPWSSARPGVSNPWRTITRFDLVFPDDDQLDLPGGFEPGMIIPGGWRVDPPDPDPCLGVNCTNLAKEVAAAFFSYTTASGAAAAATGWRKLACDDDYKFKHGSQAECDAAIRDERVAAQNKATAWGNFDELREKYKKCCT